MLGPVNTNFKPATAAIFFSEQGALSVVCLLYTSEMQRRSGEKWSRPFGLGPKTGHAALLVAHLESPNFSPRALPGLFWGTSADL